MSVKGARSFFLVAVSARHLAVTALAVGMSGLADVPQALAAPAPQGVHAVNRDCGHGHGHGHGKGKRHGKGGGRQYTIGVDSANAPAVSSPAYQRVNGRRNVNAPTANNAVHFSGTQQVTSVGVFTNALSGNCAGARDCVINQNLRSTESRGGIGH